MFECGPSVNRIDTNCEETNMATKADKRLYETEKKADVVETLRDLLTSMEAQVAS